MRAVAKHAVLIVTSDTRCERLAVSCTHKSLEATDKLMHLPSQMQKKLTVIFQETNDVLVLN